MAQTDEIRSRLLDAIAAADQHYLDEYDRGRADKEDGNPPSGSAKSPGYQDGYDSSEVVLKTEKEQEEGTPIPENPDVPQETAMGVGFHPLGGLKVYARDALGTSVEVRLTTDETWRIIGQLQAHAGMLVQLAYAQMAQSQIDTSQMRV